MNPADIEAALEQLESANPTGTRLRAKRMFGGVGIYAGKKFLAILWRGRIFLRLDASPGKGSRNFSTKMKSGRVFSTKKYWSLPDAILDDRPALAKLVERALGANMSLSCRQSR